MRSIAVAALALMGCGLVAQPYHILLDSSATWQDNYEGANMPHESSFECYSYYLEGDTIVNDTAYKILRRTGLFVHTFFGFSSSTWYSGSICMLIREDTANRKVFVRDPTWLEGPELLLYDFSAGLGPYPWTYLYPESTHEVIAVDSIVLADGPHRRITLNFGDQILEGIGSLRGFMPRQAWDNLYLHGLVCHTLHGSQDYVVFNYDCACGSNVGIPIHAISSLRVSPSPTTDLCRLEGAPPNALFRVRSMDGRTVFAGTCSNSGSAMINMADLSAAMYVVEVLGATGSLNVKVIKQ